MPDDYTGQCGKSHSEMIHFYWAYTTQTRKWNHKIRACITIWSAVLLSGSFSFFNLRHDFRYVRILFLARSRNSGNWRWQAWIMASTFSLGCLEIGTRRSRFSSTKSRTNIWKIQSIQQINPSVSSHVTSVKLIAVKVTHGQLKLLSVCLSIYSIYPICLSVCLFTVSTLSVCCLSVTVANLNWHTVWKRLDFNFRVTHSVSFCVCDLSSVVPTFG